MVDCSMIRSNLPKNLCLQKKNKSRFKQTCCRSFEKMRLKKQLLWNRNRVQQVSSSNSILCSEKSTFAKKVFLLSRKKENKKAFDICFKKKRKACSVNRSFVGKIATFCWAKKQNKASQKKKSTPINVVSKKKRRANEQNSCSFFTHHNDFVANRIFQHKTKKASKKTSTKKNTKGDENELTRLLNNNKHSFLLRTKIVTSLEERICWVSITQKDVLNLVTPLPQVQFNKIL